jgi:hypothetical protein
MATEVLWALLWIAPKPLMLGMLLALPMAESLAKILQECARGAQ